jgi:hypothetical protein
MASQWFVRQAGKVYGPFDASRMRKLAAAGKLLRDSGVAKQRQGPWTQASLVRGLFPDACVQPKQDEIGLDLVEAVTAAASRWRGMFWRKPVSSQAPKQHTDEEPWFYRQAGQTDEKPKGPLSREQINQLVEQGEVRASTLVLQLGEKRWETAFSAGLFLDNPASDEGDAIQKNSEESAGSPMPSAVPPAYEEILWDGKASHHANYGLYALCALTAPLVFPALWGMQRYAARECLRYQITSRRLRIKHEGKGLRTRDIPLASVRDAALVCPASLQATKLCNIELYGDNGRKPLAVLEGIPLADSALVISLCEAVAHRHLPVRARERLLADVKAQEEELLRRAEQRHQQELAAMRAAMHPVSYRPFIPPPPATRTVRVKGHYRGWKWIKPHKRRIRA